MCKFENERISAVCPYCNYDNRIAIEFLHQNINVIYCDLDEGGCDKMFGVKVQVKTSVELYTMEKVQDNFQKYNAHVAGAGKAVQVRTALLVKEKNAPFDDPSLCNKCGHEWGWCKCEGG